MNANAAEGYLVAVYIAYLAVSLALTVWVARTLHKNGRQFLIDTFHGNEPLADSVNHLLVVGFYLINVGFVTMALTSQVHIENVREAIELLSRKLGWVLLVLGVLHFFNIGGFSHWRRRALIREQGAGTPPSLLNRTPLTVTAHRPNS